MKAHQELELTGRQRGNGVCVEHFLVERLAHCRSLLLWCGGSVTLQPRDQRGAEFREGAHPHAVEPEPDLADRRFAALAQALERLLALRGEGVVALARVRLGDGRDDQALVDDLT